MFHMPMSSPMMTRMLGLLACARTAVGKTRILASRVSRIRIGFSFIGFVCYLLLGCWLLIVRWKNGFPIVLHADYDPAFGQCFVPCFVESSDIRLAVVSPFAFSVVVVDDEDEACARSSHCPLEHLLIAIGIPKCRNRSAANESFNTDRLALFVINELHFGEPQKHRVPITNFVLHFAAATDDLLRRNPVRLFGKATHELDATAGYDESCEAVCTQIGE